MVKNKKNTFIIGTIFVSLLNKFLGWLKEQGYEFKTFD